MRGHRAAEKTGEIDGAENRRSRQRVQNGADEQQQPDGNDRSHCIAQVLGSGEHLRDLEEAGLGGPTLGVP